MTEPRRRAPPAARWSSDVASTASCRCRPSERAKQYLAADAGDPTSHGVCVTCSTGRIPSTWCDMAATEHSDRSTSIIPPPPPSPPSIPPIQLPAGGSIAMGKGTERKGSLLASRPDVGGAKTARELWSDEAGGVVDWWESGRVNIRWRRYGERGGRVSWDPEFLALQLQTCSRWARGPFLLGASCVVLPSRVSQLQDRQPDRVALEQSSCRAPPIRGGRVLS